MYLKAVGITGHSPAMIPEINIIQGESIEKTIRGIKDLALAIAEIRPKTIVFITAQGNIFEDGISVLYDPALKGDLGHFDIPDIGAEKRCDMGLLDEMNRRFSQNDCYGLFINPNVADEYRLTMDLDYGTLIPMYYIDKVFPEYQIVHITIGCLSHYELYRTGRILREAIEVNGKDTVIVACTALSPVMDGIKDIVFDQQFYDILIMPIAENEIEAQIGLMPMIMALGATDSIHTCTRVISYEKTGDECCLEALITFDLSGDDPTCESLLKRFDRDRKEGWIQKTESAGPVVRLASRAIEKWVEAHQIIDTDAFVMNEPCSEEKALLISQAGCFVTIEKEGVLRGCKGSVMPVTDNLAHDIVYYAIEAASYDPRFIPVEISELMQCSISVDIISDIEEIKDLYELDPIHDGVIVEQGLYRGILLPNLPGIHTSQQQLEAAKRKAGIPEDYNEDEGGQLKISKFKMRHFSQVSNDNIRGCIS